jgi:hypothetical protein
VVALKTVYRQSRFISKYSIHPVNGQGIAKLGQGLLNPGNVLALGPETHIGTGISVITGFQPAVALQSRRTEVVFLFKIPLPALRCASQEPLRFPISRWSCNTSVGVNRRGSALARANIPGSISVDGESEESGADSRAFCIP